MFSIEFSRSFLKDLKKLPKEIQTAVIEKWIPKLQEDPYIGDHFKGKTLKKFSKISFRHKKNDYRIVYKIHKKEILVVLLAIGSRENFYKRLKLKKL